MQVTKVCEQCGISFTIPLRRSDEVKFCSRACKTEAGWRKLTCSVCGTEFKRKNSDNAGSISTYCTRACYYASQVGAPAKYERKKTFTNCKECGKKFQITATRERMGNANWCSKECQSNSPEWRKKCSEAQQGEKHWRWIGGLYKFPTGYVRHKRKVLKAEVATYNHRKIVTEAILAENPSHPFLIDVGGEKKLSPSIDVHHIDRVRDNNDLSNLLAVTKSAHKLIHYRNRKPEPWECWPPNPDHF